jgi:hypothetical protein
MGARILTDEQTVAHNRIENKYCPGRPNTGTYQPAQPSLNYFRAPLEVTVMRQTVENQYEIIEAQDLMTMLNQNVKSRPG